MKALVLVALLGCGSLRTKNHVVAGVVGGLLACDYGQTTRQATRGWSEYQENNPVLGSAPSPSQITAYFVAAGIALWASTNMPEWARSSVYAMALIGQSTTVLGNRYLIESGTWCGI